MPERCLPIGSRSAPCVDGAIFLLPCQSGAFDNRSPASLARGSFLVVRERSRTRSTRHRSRVRKKPENTTSPAGIGTL